MRFKLTTHFWSEVQNNNHWASTSFLKVLGCLNFLEHLKIRLNKQQPFLPHNQHWVLMLSKEHCWSKAGHLLTGNMVMGAQGSLMCVDQSGHPPLMSIILQTLYSQSFLLFPILMWCLSAKVLEHDCFALCFCNHMTGWLDNDIKVLFYFCS